MKPAYKQTEVGVIPEEWEVARLSGLVATGPKNGYSGRSSKVARGTPTLSLGATTSGSVVLNDETVKRLEETIDPLSDLYLMPGDVLVQRSNTPDLVGTTAVFDGPSEVYVYPDLMMRMRFRDDATAHWFWRYANSDGGRRFFVSVAAGSSGSMPKISGETLRGMRLPLPPLPEQRAIATALSDADGLLGGLDRLIAKKRDLKQAAMQQLLTGHTRLPGFHGEWEIASLEQLVVRATGFWGVQSLDDGHPKSADIIRAGDISPDGQLTSTASRFLSDSEFSKAQCRLDDLVITTSGNGLGKVWWCDGRANVAASNFVRVLRPIRSKAQGRFVSYVLRSDDALRQLQEHTATSAYPNLRPTFFSAHWIALPPLPEQTAIAEVLTEMDAELAGLEQRREKTRALKQAMMQELLTGRTRLT